jgi:hypothetical protein
MTTIKINLEELQTKLNYLNISVKLNNDSNLVIISRNKSVIINTIEVRN